MSRLISLTKLKSKQSGKVKEILGGVGVTQRLSVMGIRPGKMITKVSSMFVKGPVTIKVDRSRIALGFGVANKVIVEVED